MRDAFVLMSRSGKLGNLYEAFKNEFADNKKLNIKDLMEDALYRNKKGDLTTVLNNKKVAGRSFELPKAAVSSAK